MLHLCLMYTLHKWFLKSNNTRDMQLYSSTESAFNPHILDILEKTWSVCVKHDMFIYSLSEKVSRHDNDVL